jgi:hypothetical protein
MPLLKFTSQSARLALPLSAAMRTVLPSPSPCWEISKSEDALTLPRLAGEICERILAVAPADRGEGALPLGS